MRLYRIADLTVGVDGNLSDYTLDRMEPYRISDLKGLPDIRITLTKEMVDRERMLEGSGFPDDYLESIAVYREYCEQALSRDVLFFHSSAICKDGEAYLFAGPSGAGKSTHTEMWKKAFGDSIIIVNDDKPLIRFQPDGPYVYGAPWDGKEHLNTNIKVKIKAICFLSKANENYIRRLSYQEAKGLATDQIFRPAGWDHKQKNLMLTNQLLNSLPIYHLSCNMTEQAALVACDGMQAPTTKVVDHRTVLPWTLH